MGESSRVDRQNGGPMGVGGAGGNGRPHEQLGLPIDGSSSDPSERLMLELEARVVGLMERFDEARKRISALEIELAGREAQYEASASQLDALKQQIGGRLGRIIERISELEQRETNKGSDA